MKLWDCVQKVIAAMEIIILLKWNAPKRPKLRTPVISVLGPFFGAGFYHNLTPRFPFIYVFPFKKIKIGQELPVGGLSKSLIFEASLPQSCWQIVKVQLKSTV